MLRELDIPLFNCKVTENYVVVCGGGGNVDFGIENGIIIIDENNKHHHYKTDEIVIKVEVIETNKKLIITGIGNFNFYLISFEDSKFNLISQMKAEVKKVYLSDMLIILFDDGEVHSYSDVKKVSDLNNKSLFNDIKKDSQYMSYKCKSDDQIVKFVNKEDEIVIPSEIFNFYIRNNYFYRIGYTNGQSSLIINDDMFSYKGGIEMIEFFKGIPIFYMKGSPTSKLFIGSDEFKFHKITDLAINEEFVGISTVNGEIHIFKYYLPVEKVRKLTTIKVSNLPVTGISLKEKHVFYSLLSGKVGKEYVEKNNFNFYILNTMIVLIIAIIIGIYFKK